MKKTENPGAGPLLWLFLRNDKHVPRKTVLAPFQAAEIQLQPDFVPFSMGTPPAVP